MLALFLDSYTKPRDAIRHLLSIPIDTASLVRGGILVACVAAIVQYVLVTSLNADSISAQSAPIALALQHGIPIFLTALAVHRVGQHFGGSGDYRRSLKTVVWHSALMVIPSIFIFAALYSGSTPNPLFALIGLGLSVWLFFVGAVFLQELHGFQNLFLTGLAFVMGRSVIEVLTSVGLQLTGILPGGA